MHSTKLDSRGFTLIASLMLMLIMSGVAIGLLMMVNTEGKVGSQDVQNNLTFHAAEGGIEHMTSDLAAMFQNIESPTAAQIAALSADAPANTPLMSYPVYSLTAATNPGPPVTLATSWGQISTGTYQGLYAQLLPVTLQVTASTSLLGAGTVGDEVNMSRQIEVALIPVFQFGVFSDSDLGFFSSPNLDFAGRVHTNGDLYLGVATGNTLTFHDKLSAWGNVIRTVLPNGLAANAFNDSGTVLIPQATGGCDLPGQPACRAIKASEGSVIGAGGDPPTSGPTVGPPSWQTISLNSAFYNSFVEDGNYGIAGGLGTGATNLTLPFVNGTVGPGLGPQPFEIVRRPPTGEPATGPLGASRLYNEAEIRVLLSDDPNELPCGNPSVPPPCGGSADANNIRLTNPNVAGATYEFGVPASVPAGLPALASGGTYNTYFAQGTTAYPDSSTWTNAVAPVVNPTLATDWLYVPVQPIAADITFKNDQGPPAAPLTTLVANTNANGLTAIPPGVPLTPCTNTNPPVCPAAPPPATWWLAPYPFYTPLAANATNTWNLIDGYLRVEYRDVNGVYHPITAEWLQLGFARGTTPPNTAAVPPAPNPINPNAILLFQEPADRNGDGVIDQKGLLQVSGGCSKIAGVWNCVKAKPPEVTVDQATILPWYGDSKAAVQSISMYNWYPINFYDPREGESRDIQQNNNSCTPNGIMNAVELDVGNLKKWLAGNTGVSGTLVDSVSQNGYILYFSDRRGMLPSPNGTQLAGTAGTKTGDSGLEDDINSANAAGNPDGVPDPIPPSKQFSPEDTNLNGKLDNFGAGNIGLGLGYGTLAPYSINNSVNRQIINAASPDPYLTGKRLPACTVGQNNWISGARHVLKLVDGGLGNLPLMPAKVNGSWGGFTVGSENPVYIFGNYNSNCAVAGDPGCTPGSVNYDPIWKTPPGADQPGMSAAGIVADAVTVLSNAWVDVNSLYNVWPTNPYFGNNSIGFNVPAPARTASNTYYRVAIAGGKNMNFPFPGWETNADYGFGTDGGVHNFLRFVEDWNGNATLNYEGSLVSLYYATYATGTFKCCNYSVYTPPTRNYIFDPDFTKPQNLPPGTPLFRDIDNLTYRQSFTPHTGSY
jgi:Tfp pilus assembly protein PilX